MRALILAGAGLGVAGLCLAGLLVSGPQAPSSQKSESLHMTGRSLAPSKNSSVAHDSGMIHKPNPAPVGTFDANDHSLTPSSTTLASRTPRVLDQASPANDETAPVSSKDSRPKFFSMAMIQPPETLQQSMSNAPILSSGVRSIEIPANENLPLVLSEVMAEDEFTPTEIAKNAALADEFLESAARTDAVSQPKHWRQLVNQADELFRTWYGTDAFLAMDSRRKRELMNDQTGSNP